MNAFIVTMLIVGCGIAWLHGEDQSEAREVAKRYHEAFALADALPSDSDEFIRTATRERVAQVERALDLLRENMAAESVDWGVDWARAGFSRVLSPHLGPFRNLARLGVTYHDEKLKRGDHDRFVEDMAALVRAGRHLAEGQPLTHYLTSLATEGLVRAAVARNATHLPPAVRNEIVRVWRAIPPGPTLVEVIRTERLITRSGFWIIIAEHAVPGVAQASEGLAGAFRLTSSTRTTEGDWAVGFYEIETGENFRLRPGERHGDLELVAFDGEIGWGLVRCGGEVAIIEMTTRELRTMDLDATWELAIGQGNEDHILAGLLEEAGGDRLLALAQLLAFPDLENERIISLLTTTYAELPDAEEAAKDLGPISRILVPTYLRVRQSELGAKANEELLFVGLEQLRSPATPLPVSEVTRDRIRMHRTGGKLIMESSFLVRDRPMQLEFPLR